MKPRFVFNEDIGRSTWLERSLGSECTRSPLMYPGETLYRSERSSALVKATTRPNTNAHGSGRGSGSGKPTFSRAPKKLDQWRGRGWFRSHRDDDDDPPPCPAGVSLPPRGPVPAAGTMVLDPAKWIAVPA